MANKRVSQFTVVNKLSSDDIFLINQNGVTRTVGLSTIKDEIVYNSQLSLSGATNGQYPRYDASSGKWKPTDFPELYVFSQIVFAQNSGQLSINLTLPVGTWVITANFCNHEAAFPAQTLLIDGQIVQSLPNEGDPPGTSFRPMMGMLQVNGGRTITCNVSGADSGGSRRFVVRGDRIS